MQLFTPIEQLTGIGPVFQRRLKKLGIKTLQDLVFHLPHRYEDFSHITPIKDLRPNEDFCVKGEILEIANRRAWKRRMVITEAIIQDKTAPIKVIWFNQFYLTKTLKPKDQVYLSGRVTQAKDGLCLTNPAYEKTGSIDELTHMGRIIPVYPETRGLTSRWLRWLIRPILARLKNEIEDPLPEAFRKEEKLMFLRDALWQIHFPDSLKLAEEAKKRFAFENLFFIELWVLSERLKLAKEKALSIPLNLRIIKHFVESLPFKLTDGQRKSLWQILKDLEKPRPMNRLLEGDVGSGKTVVAAAAALEVAKAGFQTAFMAPTEILSKQHFKTVAKLLAPFKLDIGLLTGKEDKFMSWKLKNDPIEISRKKLIERSIKGEIDVLIGTHALIQDKVKFGKLALVILDEQHRFGVEQRAKLTRQPDVIPHLLSMTATPIPRTLALTIYGDLDLSLIDQLPEGRKKIITKIIQPADREKTYEFIEKEVAGGRQVFIICPRIEAGDKIKKDNMHWQEAKAVKEEYEKLSKIVFPNLKLAMLHGKLTVKEKEKIMNDFKNKKTDILVSTSVVEVGVDIPNATVMMIEGAERFGLAQLHQFRGRVGRSNFQSYCFLFTDSSNKKTHQRLKALITSQDGFDLAEKDLEIRGPGDFSGRRQWGLPDLAMDAMQDLALVERTRQLAKGILEEDSSLKKYPLMKRRLEEFHKRIHLE
jgi:ATP-dependent DNA helicase RecG